MDGWNKEQRRFYGLSKKRDESPAERGGVSKRPAGPLTDGAGKSSFTLKPFLQWRCVGLSKVCECDSLED